MTIIYILLAFAIGFVTGALTIGFNYWAANADKEVEDTIIAAHRHVAGKAQFIDPLTPQQKFEQSSHPIDMTK